MSKTFKTFLDDVYSPMTFIDVASMDIDAVNEELGQLNGFVFEKPEIALEIVHKFMADFGLTIPASTLNESYGEEIFGDKDLFLYFCYGLNENNTYDVFASILNEDELDSIMNMGLID